MDTASSTPTFSSLASQSQYFQIKTRITDALEHGSHGIYVDELHPEVEAALRSERHTLEPSDVGITYIRLVPS